MAFKSDIEIAQEAKPQDIREIAKKLNIKEEGGNNTGVKTRVENIWKKLMKQKPWSLKRPTNEQTFI